MEKINTNNNILIEADELITPSKDLNNLHFLNSVPERTVRPLNIVLDFVKSSLSSTFVSKGSTSICCGIRAALIHELSPSIELKLSFSSIKSHIISQDATYLKEILERLVYQVVNFDNLKVKKFESWSWFLDIDITVLESDGCLLDVAWIAILSSIYKLKLPVVDIDEDFKVHIASNQIADTQGSLIKPIQLELNSLPIITTFSQINEKFIIDPNEDEENLGASLFIIAMDENNNIHLLLKPKGTAMTDKQLKNCIADAYQNTLISLEQIRLSNDKMVE